MRACPLRRARRQRSKRLANSVKAASAGVSIGIDLGSISQIEHEMKVYLRSTTFQMSRTLTGSTRFNNKELDGLRILRIPKFEKYLIFYCPVPVKNRDYPGAARSA